MKPTSLNMVVNAAFRTVECCPDEMLGEVLRDRLGLTGTKIGCGEGECGACSVLLDGIAVTSCITPALKAQGRQVTTIEGFDQDREARVIQQAFLDTSAFQCGYCTPGFIVATKALLEVNPDPTRAEILEGISGNLCRCTGYYAIVAAVMLAARRLADRSHDQKEEAI